MDPIPYIEHSFLSIDRKIFVKYRTLPFFRNYSYPKQLFTSTPPHTTSWGGCSPFESNKVSSRGFIATFILKESEEPTFSQQEPYFPLSDLITSIQGQTHFLVTGLSAPLVLQQGELFDSDFFRLVGRRKATSMTETAGNSRGSPLEKRLPVTKASL